MMNHYNRKFEAIKLDNCVKALDNNIFTVQLLITVKSIINQPNF